MLSAKIMTISANYNNNTPKHQGAHKTLFFLQAKGERPNQVNQVGSGQALKKKSHCIDRLEACSSLESQKPGPSLSLEK
jgi:hypothetical protein